MPSSNRWVIFFNVDKITFTKPALSVSQQITKLESRGLLINDKTLAENALRNLNYYRLSGYWIYFEDSRSPHHFKKGTNFEDILELYNFEKELRFYIFEGISRFEVSLRTQFSHQFGIKYGSHSYLQPEYAKDFADWLDNMQKVKTETRRSKEIFIKHFQDKYEESFPPVWVICEIFSFGTLSCWYKNLKEIPSRNTDCPGNAKDDIAAFYNVPSVILESWIHSLTVLRNHCAHQSRLILKQISIQPMKPKSSKISISKLWSSQTNSVYNFILILLYLNNQIDVPSKWRNNFLRFLKVNKAKCIEFLNFPDDWEKNCFWD